MKPVTVYTTRNCPYCQNAKALLKDKGIPFTEKDLTSDPEALATLKARTGMRTVPQIFFGEELIGGFTDLLALDKATLDSKLKD